MNSTPPEATHPSCLFINLVLLYSYADMAALKTFERGPTSVPPLDACDVENFWGDLLMRLSTQCKVCTVYQRSKRWDHGFQIFLQHGCMSAILNTISRIINTPQYFNTFLLQGLLENFRPLTWPSLGRYKQE
jgi:hypothetical protein